MEGTGSKFEILSTSVKPHACCRYMQPPIDGILRIVKENNIEPSQVEKIRLGILRAGFPIVVEPKEIKYNPKSVVDAQFSMPFGAAVALFYRKAGLNEFSLSKIRSDQVRGIMERVECVEDPELEKTYPKQWCATAEILTKDGKRYFTKVEYCKGDPENPLSWEELIEKFHDLSRLSITKERRLKIIDHIKNFEKVQHIQKWSPILLRNR